MKEMSEKSEKCFLSTWHTVGINYIKGKERVEKIILYCLGDEEWKINKHFATRQMVKLGFEKYFDPNWIN